MLSKDRFTSKKLYEGFCKITDAVSSKRVVIYGCGFTGAFMLDLMEEMGKEILFFLDRDLNKQKSGFFGYAVKAPEEVLYEDLSDVIVIVSVGNTAKIEVINVLINLGLKEGENFIIAFEERYEPFDSVDPFLGYARSTCQNGFKCMSSYNAGSRNLICLGGSTTDYSSLGVKSWPEYLSDVLFRNELHWNVWNGGVCGYTSSQELLKLIRDGLEINPSLVISYSGYNDLQFSPSLGNTYIYDIWEKAVSIDIKKETLCSLPEKSLKVSYGSKTHLDSAEYWYRNENIMSNICEGFGIHFIAILQPSVYTGSSACAFHNKKLFQLRKTKEQYLRQSEKMKNLVRMGPKDNILDFTALFDTYNDIYFDACHVFEHGNKIIAEAIYQTLQDRKLLK